MARSPLSRTVTLLVALVALAGGVLLLWRLGGAGAAPLEPRPTGPGRDAAHAAGDLLAPLDPTALSEAGREALDAELRERARRAAERLGLRTYTGCVVDAAGAPVAGALVRAVRAGRGAAQMTDAWFEEGVGAGVLRAEGPTDAAGGFEIVVPGERLLRFAVRAPGFGTLSELRALPEPPETALADLVLEAAASLEGRVLDRAGRGVAGARIVAIPGDDAGVGLAGSAALLPATAVTDAFGDFRVGQLSAGPFELRVAHRAHPDGGAAGSLRAGETRRDLLVVLEDGERITGLVLGLDPRSVEEAAVRARLVGERSHDGAALERRVAALDPSGRFELGGLRPGGQYRLEAFACHPDEPPAVLALTARLAPPRSAARVACAGDVGVELRWRAGLRVRGRVVTAESGLPIARFTLERGGWGQDEVDARHPDGRFELELPPVSFRAPRLVVRAEGREPVELELEPGATGPLELGELRLPLSARLTLRLEAAADGRAVAGARVRLFRAVGAPGRVTGLERLMPELEAQAMSDEGGVATFPVPRGAELFLVVDHERFAPFESAPFLARAGERRVQLQVGGSVGLRVRAADGAPAPGVVVLHQRLTPDGGLWRARGPRAGRRTDGEGRLLLEHLAAGRHRFRAGGGPLGAAELLGEPVGGGRGWTELTVAEGRTQELSLELPARALLVGRVSEEGHDLREARLALRAIDGGPWIARARTDREGRFRFAEVEPGSYELFLHHSSRAMPSRLPLELGPGVRELELDLDVARVVGRVLDADRRPLAGATVAVGQVETTLAPAATTDLGGAFDLRGVATGIELALRVDAPGHQAQHSGPIAVGPGGVYGPLELVLATGGALEVRLAGPGDAPAGPCALRASFEGSAAAPVPDVVRMLGVGASVLFEGLHPGTWRVRARRLGVAPDGPAVEGQAEVRVGERAELRLRFP